MGKTINLNLKEAAEKLNISRGGIFDYLKKRRKSYAGFVWEYIK